MKKKFLKVCGMLLFSTSSLFAQTSLVDFKNANWTQPVHEGVNPTIQGSITQNSGVVTYTELQATQNDMIRYSVPNLVNQKNWTLNIEYKPTITGTEKEALYVAAVTSQNIDPQYESGSITYSSMGSMITGHTNSNNSFISILGVDGKVFLRAKNGINDPIMSTESILITKDAINYLSLQSYDNRYFVLSLFSDLNRTKLISSISICISITDQFSFIQSGAFWPGDNNRKISGTTSFKSLETSSVIAAPSFTYCSNTNILSTNSTLPNGCSYQWTINGKTLPLTTNTSLSSGITTNGIYNATLSIVTTNDNCQVSTVTQPFTVNKPEISLNSAENCHQQLVLNSSYKIPSNAILTWSFGDGSPSVILNSSSIYHDYPYNGNFTASLTISGNTNACDNYTLSLPVVITNACPCLKYSLSNPNYTNITKNTTINSSTGKEIWSNKVYIADNTTVTVEKTILDITNVDVELGSGAKIVFTNGASINANNSVFKSCDESKVWIGLQFVTDNGTIPSGNIDNCEFRNAKSAIEVTYLKSNLPSILPTIDLKIKSNEFYNCMYSIALKHLIFKRSIESNSFINDNTSLPFSSYYTPVVELGRTNFGGIMGKNVEFTESIANNKFSFNSNVLTNNATIYSILLREANSNAKANITNNEFTNTKVFIEGTSIIKDIQIENNKFTNSFVSSNNIISNPYSIYLNNGNTVLIKGNSFYNNGSNSRPTLQLNSLSAVYVINSNFVTINENNILGYEFGMNILNSTNVFVKSNSIKKAKFYGIYSLNNRLIDITCNSIDLQLKTSENNNAGIAIFNDNSNTSTTSVIGSVRNNCILNSNNAIYTENKSSNANLILPFIVNNFLFNYTNSGVYNKGFASKTSSPYSVRKNTFQSNNSSAAFADIYSDKALPIELNYGVINGNLNVNPITSNNSYSTASCASNIGLLTQGNANIGLTSNNGEQLCDYYYQSQNTNNDWNNKVRLESTSQVDTVYGIESDLVDKIINLSNDQVLIYPNPTSGNVEIEYVLNSIDSDSKIEIFNMLGEKISSIIITQNVGKFNIDLSNEMAGIYFAKINTLNNELKTIKIVKK